LGIPATVQAALAELYQGLVKTAQGFIPIPLGTFRELAAGLIPDTAGAGGNLANDTTPALENIGDGDAARIKWVAGNTDEVQASIQLPPDIDLAEDLVVHFTCSKSADANVVHMDGEAHFGEGDADCFPAAGASNLIAAAKSEITATILAADLPADVGLNGNMTLLLKPEAHAGDIVYLHSAWLEYTKKLLTS